MEGGGSIGGGKQIEAWSRGARRRRRKTFLQPGTHLFTVSQLFAL